MTMPGNNVVEHYYVQHLDTLVLPIDTEFLCIGDYVREDSQLGCQVVAHTNRDKPHNSAYKFYILEKGQVFDLPSTCQWLGVSAGTKEYHVFCQYLEETEELKENACTT